MFVYSAARILSERTGLAMHGHPFPDFPNAEMLDGRRLPHGRDDQGLRDMRHHVHLTGDRAITLTGYYQQWPPLEERAASVRHWFFRPRVSPIADTVVSIRRGDFVGTHWESPMSAFDRMVEEAEPCGSMAVVSDDPEDECVCRFASRHNARIVAQEPMHDFDVMVSAPTLLMSNSTFSWWAAFLGGGRVFSYLHRASPWHPDNDHHSDLLWPGVNWIVE